MILNSSWSLRRKWGNHKKSLKYRLLRKGNKRKMEERRRLMISNNLVGLRKSRPIECTAAFNPALSKLETK